MISGEEIAYDLILSLLVISFIIFAIVLFFFCRKKPVKSEEIHSSVRVSAPSYPLTEIDTATDGFHHRRIVGKGRLGTVYAALLANQELVAVKRIHPSLVLSNAGFGFSSILKSLSLAQHPNIVPILGFSQAPGERIIVMEFVGMASLDFYLHESTSDGGSLLDWNRRLKVAAGAARGLQYLHEGIAPNIIHGCFKASNILLDVKFCARVCDYGLYFLVPNEKRGLVGYVDDEYWSEVAAGGGGACKASDVFGFGVVLLELLSGRRSEGGLLVKWALPLIKEMKFNEVLDPKLAIFDMNQSIIRLAKVASACVSNTRKSRPTIVQVASILNSLEIEING
ncbi:leucine-rich repeat receptor protein kinase EMS1 [Mercurialis annua]|uniref:leucine-rich repeat receptor protein kinase EMS1 n=1 Tax=Mercurialis annua TaxID=3986 RepID=UPI00215F6237|nr:leucine-rich repeat receptor protein kinase EMS1 [Mercurialis annua]